MQTGTIVLILTILLVCVITAAVVRAVRRFFKK